MKLRSTLTSPFGRKVRIAALHLGLMHRIEIVPADPLDPADTLREHNPLGKMPVLILDDGRRLYDSRVILEHLDHLAGGGAIIPRDWDARLACLTTQALADGIMDAALLIVYESRHRPEAMRHPPWLDYQRGKITRGLADLAGAAPNPRLVDAASIAAACMLGYLDWREQVDWRREVPVLQDWLEAFRTTTAAYDATAVVG